MSVLLPGAQLIQKLVMKIAGRNGSLLHEQDVKCFCGKAIAENVSSFLAQREDLFFSQPVGNSLGRPFRVTEDGPLSAVATGALGRGELASHNATRPRARAGQEVTHLREEINRIVIRHPASVQTDIDAHAQVSIEFSL